MTSALSLTESGEHQRQAGAAGAQQLCKAPTFFTHTLACAGRDLLVLGVANAVALTFTGEAGPPEESCGAGGRAEGERAAVHC